MIHSVYIAENRRDLQTRPALDAARGGPPGRPDTGTESRLNSNAVVYSAIAAPSFNCRRIPVRTLPELSHNETAW
jgi:hypothetical protein